MDTRPPVHLVTDGGQKVDLSGEPEATQHGAQLLPKLAQALLSIENGSAKPKDWPYTIQPVGELSAHHSIEIIPYLVTWPWWAYIPPFSFFASPGKTPSIEIRCDQIGLRVDVLSVALPMHLLGPFARVGAMYAAKDASLKDFPLPEEIQFLGSAEDWLALDQVVS